MGLWGNRATSHWRRGVTLPSRPPPLPPPTRLTPSPCYPHAYLPMPLRLPFLPHLLSPSLPLCLRSSFHRRVDKRRRTRRGMTLSGKFGSHGFRRDGKDRKRRGLALRPWYGGGVANVRR